LSKHNFQYSLDVFGVLSEWPIFNFALQGPEKI